MKSKSWLAAVVCVVSVFGQSWQAALAPYIFHFPEDHFNHPAYQTEWWYYTGNVRAADGHRFGFELTFFRSAAPANARVHSTANAVWTPDQVYLAHLAVSDLDARRFYHDERINRAGPGLAGVNAAAGRCWNGNWEVRWTNLPQPSQQLTAVSRDFRMDLALAPEKRVVANGEGGVSVKGPLPGEASHYLSFTHLHANGGIIVGGKVFAVDGLAWMDHEFFSEPGDSGLLGWDWFSIQLDNREELMLYRLRRRGSPADPYSSGTFVDAGGVAHHLQARDFTLTAADRWGPYPAHWHIAVPSLLLQLDEQTNLPDQELVSRSGTTPSYWEGAVAYSGTREGRPVSGVGYLEMTGYAHPVWLGAK